MLDEMFFSGDERSLVRGNRIAARTETCRPCLVSTRDAEARTAQGIIMDMTPHGLLVRMIETLPVGSEVVVQMMRDDEFRERFAEPRHGSIIRVQHAEGGYTDHGVKLIYKAIPKANSRPVFIEKRGGLRKFEPPRMHTIDFTIGGPRGGRRGR